MPRKKTYEEVKRVFEDAGYSLISTEYINNRSKLDYICPNGHKGSISYANFSHGFRCRKCANDRLSGKHRRPFEEVRRAFEKEGYELLSDESDYKNKDSKLLVKCPNGHTRYIRVHSFFRGTRCAICSRREAGKRKRLSFDQVKALFESAGYTLLSSACEYKGNKTPLKYKCPKGHIETITYSRFKSGQRCPVCAGNKTHSFNEVYEYFKNEGYTLLSTDYKNNQQTLYYTCPEGHYGHTSFGNFKAGKRCSACAGNKRYTIDEIVQLFASYGYTVTSTEYINAQQKIQYICPEGHTGSITYNHFRDGKRCGTCFRKASNAERTLRDYVSGLLGDGIVTYNTRDIIPPLELDIYIPSKKLAIEYCGLYWHSEIGGEKPRYYHRKKMELCEDKGIRLITIFEDEYIIHPEVVKSRIANALGAASLRIYARKCEVRPISRNEANHFLDTYHLQGKSRASVYFGLFYKDELVQVLTLGPISRHHASKVNGVHVRMLELKRFASKPFVSVVGGAGKLFKEAVAYAKKHNFCYIKSYSDNRYANRHNPVYEKLGFELIQETKYTPHYVREGVRYRNQRLRKTAAERKLGKTEWELRQEQGYDRIWDCGHRTYLYEVR